MNIFLFIKQTEQSVGLTLAQGAGIGDYARSITMVEVLLILFQRLQILKPQKWV